MAKILIVDDRPANRELLVTLLGYVGHHLLEAVDGEQGLVVARAEHPDLIITDIVMPKMDGYEFARQVRSDPSISKTQIIFYTSSYIVEETRSLAHACGVSIVVGKPIEPEMFLEIIRKALDNHEALSTQPVPDEFHSEHMRILTDTLAKKVDDLETEIIERKQAEEQVRAQAARLKILADASHTFSASVQNYQAALDQVTRLVVDTLADMCQIRLLSDNQERLELAAIYSLDTELSETIRALESPAFDLANDPGLAAQVMRTGKPVLLSSITLEQLWASNPPEYRPIFERFAPHSFILVPLRIEGRSIGGLGLTRYRNDQPAFTDDDLSLAQDLADRAALAINSARLFQQVQNELAERKRAETQLAEAHEFLEKIVTYSPIGILTYKFTGECLSANQYAAYIVGATVDELLSQNFHEIDSWKRSGLYDLAEKTIATRQEQKADIHLITSFDKAVWLTVQFVVFQSGFEDCLLLTISDITERKQAEVKLQESEQRYKLLFRQILYGFALHEIICDEAGKPVDYRYLEVNPAFEKLTGLQASELIGRTVLEVLPGTEAYWIETFGKVAMTGETVQFNNYSQELGKYYEVAAYSPKPGQFAVIFMDVSERKQAEKEIASLAKFPSENPNPVLRLSQDGILTFANVASEMILRMWGCAVGGLAPEFWRDLAAQALASRENKTVDIKCDGKVYSMFVAPIEESDYVNIYGQDVTERRQVEQALSESEAHYRQIIQTAHEGIGTVDTNNRITLVNQRLADMFGYTVEEMLGKTIFEFMDEEGQAIAVKSLENRRLGINEQLDFKYIRKDGGVIWAITETSTLLDHDGNYAGALAMFTDITERRRADDALKLAYSQLSNLYDNLPQAVFSIDIVQNKMLQASPAHETIFGYSPDEFFKNPRLWYEIVVPEDKASVDASYPVLFAGKSVQQEYRILRPDGKIRWIEVIMKPNLADDGKLVRVDGIASDITERKQIEQALRESQEHYRQIIETAQEGIWAIDTNLRTTLANQHLADMLGYTIEEMIGRSVYEFMDEEGKAIAAKSLENRRQGINEQLDFKYIRKDGSVIWTIIETSTLYDQDGNYAGALAMLTDITERRQAEEKIRQQLRYLTALSEIDRAISSSFDLQLSLDTVLLHVVAQLGVDAADVLLFDSAFQGLEYAAGQGFHSPAIQKAPILLSKGHAARAVLNRRPVYIPDLKKQPDDSPRSALFEREGFVSYYAVPLFAKGELNGVLGIFHRSRLEPDKEWLDFLNTLAGQCAIAIDNATLFNGMQRSNIELALAYDATIAGWSHALDLRDKETEGHSRRVTDMSIRLAHAMGISKEEQVQIRRGALLHDIGKMGVPDGILLKPGALTDEEWAIMKKHPGLAYEMLSPIAYLKPALDIPYCHHEKWDGTGYPRGLKGEQIPLAARIFAIVDVWDALRSDRPYRAAWPIEKVREHIRSLSGTHFDPQVVTVFLDSNVMRLV
jgi:PAS domain S-box-containing protein